MRQNLAPSYKAIAIAILKNDLTFSTLGFTPPKSKWYMALKKVEIEQRTKDAPGTNYELF
jgi:predicted phosphoadenosine phosphosulfate sulfurtransferase